MNEDHAIVDAVLARRPGAFEALVQANERLVWHVLLRLVARREEAEELCQDVFLKVFRQLHGFRFESALSTWIGRIAFSVGSRHLRRKQLPLAEPAASEDGDALDQLPDGLDLQQAVETADEVARLNIALAQLPALQRTVVSLYHLDELPIQQIAEITELPEGTIKSHLFRARRVLRERLQ